MGVAGVLYTVNSAEFGECWFAGSYFYSVLFYSIRFIFPFLHSTFLPISLFFVFLPFYLESFHIKRSTSLYLIYNLQISN